MENPQASVLLLGDEDRAKQLVPKALHLFHSGFHGAVTDDEVTITVSDSGVSIEAQHHAPIQLFSPLDTGEGLQYYLWLLGCSHRKDAMFTAATYRTIASSYAGSGFSEAVGPEMIYMTDGICFVGHAAQENVDTPLRTYKQFIGMFGIAGVTEDIITEGTDTVVGPGRVKNAMAEIACVGAEMQQGDNMYSACCYGVDRTEPDRPRYRFIIGASIHTDAVQNNGTWNSAKVVEGSTIYFTGVAHYYNVEHVFVYITAQRDAAPTAFYYSLGYDVVLADVDYDTSDNTEGFVYNPQAHNGPFPICIPLGDQRVFIVHRKKAATDTAKLFGGTFDIYGTVVSTMGMSQAAADVSALKVYLTTSPIEFGRVGTAGVGDGYFLYDFPEAGDVNTMWWIMESLAVRARQCIPISQDETLVIGQEAVFESWTPPGDTNGTPNYFRQVCYSFTSTGVTKKSTLVECWGHVQGRYARDYFYDFKGACHGTAQNVIVLFERWNWTGAAWVKQGLYRFFSDDDGATWTGPTLVTLTNDEDAEADWYASGKLIFIDRNAADTGDIVAFGLADVEAISGGKLLKNPKLMTSEDSGLTFTAHKSGGAGRQLTWMDGYVYYHSSNGLVSAHMTGDGDEGFEPSPYRHLPTYYGTPTKVCRTATNDTGL